MDFEPNEYVRPENLPGGAVEFAFCRYCGRALLVTPGSNADCGMHLN
ncbi:MAG TPA: hypothetical protein VHS56_01755 [Candidatus Cybelea sp.]|jgi:hypothetical protein|nr:hypothetical protein [Candidatus Cybelea sp.]